MFINIHQTADHYYFTELNIPGDNSAMVVCSDIFSDFPPEPCFENQSIATEGPKSSNVLFVQAISIYSLMLSF